MVHPSLAADLLSMELNLACKSAIWASPFWLFSLNGGMGLIRDIRRALHNINEIAEHLRHAPSQARTDWAATGEDLFKALCASAMQRSIEIVEQEMPDAIIHTDYARFLSACLARISSSGAKCEFGVYSGASINLMASMRPDLQFDGFDSFRGLPGEWSGYREFDFNREGQLPQVRENVRLHVGLFEESLPGYARTCQAVSFLHIDCDLYSSTSCVFKQLGAKLSPGCVVVFDEYFGYPGFERHERKAFQEFLSSTGRKALWFACCGQRAACVLS